MHLVLFNISFHRSAKQKKKGDLNFLYTLKQYVIRNRKNKHNFSNTNFRINKRAKMKKKHSFQFCLSSVCSLVYNRRKKQVDFPACFEILLKPEIGRSQFQIKRSNSAFPFVHSLLLPKQSRVVARHSNFPLTGFQSLGEVTF